MTTNRRRWTPLAVAGALLLLYLLLIPIAPIVIGVTDHNPRDEAFIIAPAIALLLAQWSLYSGWAVLGDGPWMPRFAAAVFGLVAPTFAIEWIVPGAPLAVLLLLALAYASLVGLPLAIARGRGYRCRLPGEAADAITSRQFSLRQIFGLTTVVAAMMTLVRLLGPLQSGGDLLVLILIFLSPAAITWAAFPLLLRAPLLPGSIGVLLLCGLIGGLLELLFLHRMEPWLTLSLMLNLGVLLILSLGALRLSGYLLMAQAVTADPPPTPDL